MAHRYHPNDEDPSFAYFYDDCDDCAEKAAQPIYSQNYNRLMALWELMLAVELNNNGPFHYLEHEPSYLTENEAIACKALRPFALFLQRVTTIQPEEISSDYGLDLQAEI